MTGSTLALLSSAGGRTRRAPRQTAAHRNHHICEAAETVLIACARPGSDIEALAQALIAAGKPARPFPPSPLLLFPTRVRQPVRNPARFL